MSNSGEKEVALKLAWKMLMLPYKWGGDDPIEGYDCSGFVVEILQSVGLIGRYEDFTAHMLWDRFMEMRVDIPYEGCLVFWENLKGHIIHIEMCLNGFLSIGASGGGSKTTDLRTAVDGNAFVKIRPFASRKGIKGFIDPFMEV